MDSDNPTRFDPGSRVRSDVPGYETLTVAHNRQSSKGGLIVGFDGISVGEWLTPSLTTAVQPAEQMGQWAMQHLIERIDEDVPVKNLVLPHQLRQGESLVSPPF